MSDFAKLNDRDHRVRPHPARPDRTDVGYLWDSEKRGEWFASGAMPTRRARRFHMQFKHSKLSPNTPPPEKISEMDKNGHSRQCADGLEPPHRLAFTFGGEKPPTDSEVEFRLRKAVKDNKVRLTLTHSKIPDRAYAVGVSGGWHGHLECAMLWRGAKPRPPSGTSGGKYDGVYDKRYCLIAPLTRICASLLDG